MSLKSLVSKLDSAAAADRVVALIHGETFVHPHGEAAYLERFFRAEIREAVFRGGSVNGRYVTLSPAAQLLKSAFQRRYASTGDFPPFRGYHVTSDPHIAGLIAIGGFIKTTGTVCGTGAYFFDTSRKAEDYLPPVVAQGPNDNNAPAPAAVSKVVLEVTVFSRRVSNQFPDGADRLTFYRQRMGIFVVKNPLVIFPTAVFKPGDKSLNVDAAAQLVDL